ncbi:hypothetical protein [Lentzea sp.]|uniref:hypothetical protein n=1 Tax=Lentzea sp. TaxID=56099 RepID=UPI002BEE1F39|nr:hypothetical protein [Lentzea sp.]HUQ58977.1 hypothetical protein [Lentzea sp.]
MSEQEIREGMLLAVWDEPPLDFDPDKLIRRVEQKKSRRRALVAVGVATAVIAVASLSLPGLLPRDRDEQFASEGQVTTTAPPSEPAERRVRRIGDAIAARLDQVTGDVKDIYGDLRVGQYPYAGYPSTPVTTSVPKKPGGVEMSGFILFTDLIGPTALRVEAGNSGFSKSSFCAGATTCREVPQDDGTVVHEAVFNDGGPDVSRAQVARVFRSGYVVRISSHNYNPASGAGLRQTVPLPVGVLTSLVMDPFVPWQ